MTQVIDELISVAQESGFSGVVRVERAGELLHESAHGMAHRAHGVPNAPDTRIAVASGAKGFTALTVLRLVDDGVMELDAPVRPLLGRDLPLIDPDVTVRHLLAHRSGIGDYLDEEAQSDITGYPMAVPVHRLLRTGDYLEVLDGHPQVFPPGTRFRYCNGGYVVLALLVERTTGEEFHDVVARCVLQPAGLTRTAYLRSDRLPGDAALGYLDDETPGWSNVLHLPVRGSGDGGIHTTAAEVIRLWAAVMAGAVVSAAMLREMTTAASSPATASGSFDYGLGCWLRNPSHVVEWEGYDAGASFRSGHDRASGLSYAVLSNTTEGAWPVADAIGRMMADRTL